METSCQIGDATDRPGMPPGASGSHAKAVYWQSTSFRIEGDSVIDIIGDFGTRNPQDLECLGWRGGKLEVRGRASFRHPCLAKQFRVAFQEGKILEGVFPEILDRFTDGFSGVFGEEVFYLGLGFCLLTQFHVTGYEDPPGSFGMSTTLDPFD